MDFTNKYIGEYSQEQGAYHITTLDDAVKQNLEMYARAEMNGYMPICYGDTYEEVARKLDDIRERYPLADIKSNRGN